MATKIDAPDKEKEKALNVVLTQLEHTFGKGTIMRLGDATRMQVATISSGALTLGPGARGGTAQGTGD